MKVQLRISWLECNYPTISKKRKYIGILMKNCKVIHIIMKIQEQNQK